MAKVRYNDHEFDSEHEAICSALFDRYGWRWERPETAIGGWRPDFILKGKTEVLVECKGALHWDDVGKFQELPKYQDAVWGTNYEVLLIPKSPKNLKYEETYDFSALGYLYDRQVWSYAELGRWSGQVGFCHKARSWKDRMSGNDVDLSSGDGRRPNVEQDWDSAIQVFRGKRVSYFQAFTGSEIEYWDMSSGQ